MIVLCFTIVWQFLGGGGEKSCNKVIVFERRHAKGPVWSGSLPDELLHRRRRRPCYKFFIRVMLRLEGGEGEETGSAKRWGGVPIPLTRPTRGGQQNRTRRDTLSRDDNQQRIGEISVFRDHMQERAHSPPISNVFIYHFNKTLGILSTKFVGKISAKFRNLGVPTFLLR